MITKRVSSAVVKAVALSLLILVIFLLRRPEILFRPQFWAEDGSIFFQDQMNFGFWRALITPYNAYLHVIPRLISGGAMLLLPIRWIPAGFSFVSLAITAASCGAFYWIYFRRLIASDMLRAACCLLAATTVPVASELLGTICNLQWFLSVLMILLIVKEEPEHLRFLPEFAMTVVQMLIALSAPAILVYMPFLIWNCVKRTKWGRVRPVLTIAALAIELAFILHSSTEKPNLNFNSIFLSTVEIGISRAVLAPIIGVQFIFHDTERAFLVKVMLALMILVSLFVVVILNLATPAKRLFALAAAYIGTGTLAFVMAGRNLAPFFLSRSGMTHTDGTRYFFIPSCMLIFFLAITAELASERWKNLRSPLLAPALLVALFGLGIVRDFQSTPLKDMSWPLYAGKIEKWDMSVRSHEPVGRMGVPINPAPWLMVLSPEFREKR